MWRWGRMLVLTAIACLAVAPPVQADFPDGHNHPEVRWLELETDHFVMVFGEGLDETARLAAKILEEAHGPLAEFLDVTPAGKTTVVLSDFDDVGFNNFARRLQHVIYISNPVMNQARVDTEQWLSHLLPHEYAHVLNGWAYDELGGVAGNLVEWTGMEYQPQWFTEGLAEYASSRQSKDESAFVLQAAQQGLLLHGAQLDLAETRFDVIETSVMYKQGHSMCIYLAEKYGEDIFSRILTQYARTPQFDLAFRLATGDRVEQFSAEWLERTLARAASRPDDDPVLVDSVPYPTGIDAALGARMSPDGSRVAVYGVEDWEQPIPGLWLLNPETGTFNQVADNLDLYDSWKLSWSPDSRYLLYAGRHKDHTGAVINQFYRCDVQSQEVTRLETGGLRVGEPEYSPDGSRIAFTCYRGERALIATMPADGGEATFVTQSIPQNCFSATWSPDGQSLAFSLADPNGTDIAVIGVDGTGFRRLTEDPWPDQYPDWSPDGRQVAFVSYREPTGTRTDAAVSAEAQGLAVAATNLYTVSATGGDATRLTAATSGGCFYPAWTPDGSGLLFSLFQVRTATIRRLPLSAAPAVAAGPVDLRPNDAAPAPVRVASSTPVPAPAAAPRPPASATDAVALRSTLGPAVVPVAAEVTNHRVAPLEMSPVRRYRPWARIVPYVWRPYHAKDGLGDAFGGRVRFADPLLKHQFLAEVQYGTGQSNQWGYQFQYRNDQTPFSLGANVFRRVPAPRGERGALVAETSTGIELLAELPVAVFGDPYSQDKLQLGFEYADHEPFETSGGLLRPAPRGAVIAGPSLGWRRVQLLPGWGEQEMSAKLTRSDDLFGADLDFFSADVVYVARLFAPTPRSKVSAGMSLNYLNGEDFSRAEVERFILTGEARYDWRIFDQLASRRTWPYVHLGPIYLTGSYQLRELLSGTSGGADLRDLLQLGLRSDGYLTRNAVFEFQAGPTFYVGSPGETDWNVTLEFDFRELPF